MDPLEAAALQDSLRSSVRLVPLAGTPSSVAGVDVAYASSASPTLVAAAVVALSFPSLSLVTSATASRVSEFLYVPGLLAFRELPFVLAALADLDATPDVIDATGRSAIPRRFADGSAVAP